MKWRNIKGGPYQVNELGQIRNSKTLRVMKPQLGSNGYYKVNLVLDNKVATRRIHRLVAAAFLRNPLDKPEVHHINGDKLDNRLENLTWADADHNRWFSRNITKHSVMVSFKKVETLYKENKSISLKTFIKRLKDSLDNI